MPQLINLLFKQNDEFRTYGIDINHSFSEKAKNVIPLALLKKLPDLSFARELSRDQDFSIFIPSHRKMADALINVFLGK